MSNQKYYYPGYKNQRYTKLGEILQVPAREFRFEGLILKSTSPIGILNKIKLLIFDILNQHACL